MSKLKPLVISALILGGGNLTSSAFTVEDLCGQSGTRLAADRIYWSENDKFGHDEVPLGASEVVKISYYYGDDPTGLIPSTTKVQIEGITGWTSPTTRTNPATFVFTLADENNNATNNGTRLILPNEYQGYPSAGKKGVSTDTRYFITAGSRYAKEFQEVYGMVYSFGSNSAYSAGYTPYWVGEIIRNDDGEFSIEFNGPATMLPTSSYTVYQWGKSVNSNYCRIFDHYRIDTFTPNGTFKFKKVAYNWQGGVNGSYAKNYQTVEAPVKFWMDENGDFRVLNLLNEGYAVKTDPKCRFEAGYYTGHYDKTTGIATLDGGQAGWKRTGNPSNQNARTMVMPGFLTTVDPKTRIYDSDFKDIIIKTASGEAEEITTLFHYAPFSNWVTNGGGATTHLMTGTMKFQPFAFLFYVNMNANYQNYEPLYMFDSSAAYLDGEFSGNEDVTLALSHNINQFGTSASHYLLDSYFSIDKNDRYVESYEVWLCPNKDPKEEEEWEKNPDCHKYVFGDVRVAPFLPVHLGHDQGQQIDRVVAGKLNGHTSDKNDSRLVARAESRDEVKNIVHRFYNYVAKDDIQNPHRFEKYSLYLKANYKPETRLTPTYHGLVTIEDKYVTGVESIGTDMAQMMAFADGGAIAVINAPATVEVYTLSGMRVYRGNDSRIELPAGLYIVRSGSTAVKVAIR